MAEIDSKRTDGGSKWSLAGAVATAVGASVCCVGPLLLLALGIGGAWVGNLTAMEKYRPFWMVATLVLLGLAFVRTYRRPKEGVCAPGSACAPNARRRNKLLLWVVTVIVLGLLALPYAIPYAFGGEPGQLTTTQQAILSLRNMNCSACVVTVKKSLGRVEGVKDVKVTLDPPRAVVIYDPTKVTPERLAYATTNAGFPSMIVPEGGKR